MPGFFSSVIATFVTIPLLGFIVVFIVSKAMTKNHRNSVLIASDVSTLLLIFAVHFIVIAIWKQSYLWLILLLIIFIAIIYVIMFWKLKQEIVFVKVFRGFWRLNFLVFLFVYIVLLLFGLFQRVYIHLTFVG